MFFLPLGFLIQRNFRSVNSPLIVRRLMFSSVVKKLPFFILSFVINNSKMYSLRNT